MWKYVLILILSNLLEASSSFSKIEYLLLDTSRDTEPPKITGTNEIRVIRGTNAVIECKIIEGLPKPKITWEYKDKYEQNFKPLPGLGNELSLLSVTDQNGGSYKCVATNVAGEDEHITHLVIDWEKYSIEDDALVIKNLNESDSTSYTCEAQNYVGSANAAFIVRVYTAPKISGLAEVKVIKGSNAVIECNIIKGTPVPDITWLYWDKVVYKNLEKSFGSKRLLLPNVEEKNAGSYKCVGANVAGTDEYITTLIIESPPTIVSESSIEYAGLEGDIAFRIPCDVIGLQESEEVPTKNPYIEIVKPTLSNDGNYTCRISDAHGHTCTHTYVVDVGYPPKVPDNFQIDDWRGDIGDIPSSL
ncbi:hemicentin-2-like [Helicoverpa zea]|uniref:hemicentin-2-like n=1 Tax=Helicoverpa zea TaxID=7113 RepID=UPI001F596ED6|nr:hemicentin-2-like [Helicoverpa zea]